MHPNRRRKKRPNYGLRTVEILRCSNGYGFTISGQQPCILSCIVSNSPADQGGLRAGDFLISVNGISVSKMAHDAVVSLIANCVGPIKMTIAENYYSDSSDEELECGRMVGRKPKYMHKPRQYNRRFHKGIVVEPNEKNVTKIIKASTSNDNVVNAQESLMNLSNPMPMDGDEAGPIEYKALIGYLGTIEMPKQLLPNSRLQTVCSCIRKLRQEKRTPTTVLMTILPTCLTLKNSSNHIIAIYPTNRVVYIGSATDKESRYFGLVTSAVCESRGENSREPNLPNQRQNAADEVDISNSCHVFMVDSKIVNHRLHMEKAEAFKIVCTPDAITGSCLEFPQYALYIVNLVQTMYQLQNEALVKNDQNIPVIANSPQPSASSNSDSGIGYRDDCGNVSDRILVVEFPTYRPLPVISKSNTSNRPHGIDGGDFSLNAFDFQQPSVPFLELNNKSPYKPNKIEGNNGEVKPICGYENIKNNFENPSPALLHKHNNLKENNKLTCRALLLDSDSKNLLASSPPSKSISLAVKYGDVDSGQTFVECPIDVSASELSMKETVIDADAPDAPLRLLFNNTDFKRSIDEISVQGSTKSGGELKHVFRVPLEARKSKKSQAKRMSSCENINNKVYHKLSPKVYGVSKVNYSCEELSNADLYEDKFCYGSLQDISGWMEHGNPRRTIIAQSEPDVRINHRSAENSCDHSGGGKLGGGSKGAANEGPAAWATSFEKLLDDPVGLHAFAEFLKKEFSAENIYFWTACERYRRLTSPCERTSEAQKIFKQHLESGAIEAVNVDAQGRLAAEQGLAAASSGIFEIAQKQIFNLMKFDSYPRFLKSQLYKQCLSGEVFAPAFDSRLALHNTSQLTLGTPSKLKKSLSNAEDRRRKSLLPWHRKTTANQRSKSRDRNDMAVTQKSWDGVLTVAGGEDSRRLMSTSDVRDIHSSHSSLTSLDLAASQDSVRQESGSEGRTALCRVLLSNGSTTVVQIKEGESIQQLIGRLLEKRGLNYSSYEVYTNKHPKAIDVNESSTKLSGCEVTIEQRVVFKLDLPNRKIISVKSKYTKIIVDVLRPILHKYKFTLEQVTVTRAGYPVDIGLQVTTIDNARLNIQLKEVICTATVVNPVIKINNVKISKLEEITNKVFEGILQEKSDGEAFKQARSEKGSVKSEDWGSEHSSGLLGKFLRRDSAMHEKKKKIMCQRPKPPSSESREENNAENNHKKPLIAKLKAGANKLHVGTHSESDELVEGLTRAQRRLEDQRGTEINFELPDFLKDKEDDKHFLPPESPSRSECQSKIAFTKNLLRQDVQPNYENQHITASPATSPVKNNYSSSPEKTPSSVLDSNKGPSKLDPPPLPPKPKIVPIKPLNWGHSGFYKANKEVPLEKRTEMFLEQPSSSFV